MYILSFIQKPFLKYQDLAVLINSSIITVLSTATSTHTRFHWFPSSTREILILAFMSEAQIDQLICVSFCDSYATTRTWSKADGPHTPQYHQKWTLYPWEPTGELPNMETAMPSLRAFGSVSLRTDVFNFLQGSLLLRWRPHFCSKACSHRTWLCFFFLFLLIPLIIMSKSFGPWDIHALCWNLPKW